MVKVVPLLIGGRMVYDDADVEAAAQSIVDLTFANSGQVCVSPNRCFVHESIYERFNEVHYAVHLPHGGLKQSGVGKDCSQYSLQEYLTLKRVSVLVNP